MQIKRSWSRKLCPKDLERYCMDRIFHRSLTIPTICGIVLFSLLAFYMFWIKAALLGMLLMFVVVGMVERVLNTNYKFTENERGEVLLISNGRFSRTKELLLNEIVECRRVKVSFGLSQYLLLEYGMNKIVGVQPDNMEEFLKELKKRQERIGR